MQLVRARRRPFDAGSDSRTEWHRCTAWGKLSEFADKLEKGAHVQIEGELRYREY